ncbi:MAG TPA: helix-turn-helix domain-containing protein [Pirellulales bacterium]|jgi:excisionase family DNA binding protein|nr:helix-turn-helix domain-containing protein [Pirellulales bacterium]
MTSYRTPPQIAEQLGIATSKVLAWIARGELSAVNLAAATSTRPRWRISRDALETFLSSRQSRPKSVPTKVRRARMPNVKSYV